ncbi:MAG: hypothetical protein ACTSO7_18375 [Candidatus Heimdallarchaeota archaeon]
MNLAGFTEAVITGINLREWFYLSFSVLTVFIHFKRKQRKGK